MVAVATGAGAEPGPHAVDAPIHPLGPPGAHLVGHGVGERLHGVLAADGVPVHVQQVVQPAQRQGAVTAEQGEAGRPEAAAPEPVMVGREHRQWTLPMGGWASALVDGHDGPQLVAEAIELGEEVEALRGQRGQLPVDPGEAVQAVVAFDVPAEPGLGVQVRVAPVGGEAMTGGGRGRMVHGSSSATACVRTWWSIRAGP